MTRAFVLALLLGCGGSAASPDASPPTPDAPPPPPDADACATSVVASPGTVITASGPVTGTLDGSVYAWKGIPYAAPPVGDLRWKAPTAPSCWTDARQTTAFGAQCPQVDSTSGQVVGDEDCLTLNVWAPTAASGAPVMVFIHGGGNTQGTASDPTYDGAALATATGAVVVTFDYRLGALGFFANAGLDAESPQHVSGNYGILDQIAALTWVKTNIAGFGGAPGRVMVFGESAGAQDTLIHVASPLSSGLFAAATVESGGSYKTTLAQNETAMQAVVDAESCTSASSVPDCMRAVPAQTLAAIPSAVGPLDSGLRYVPSVDGYVLADTVPNLIAAGTYNQVPMIIGTNGDETSRMVVTVKTEADYEAAVQMYYGNAASALLALYPAASYASVQAALVAMTTDVTWTCPIRRLARSASAHQSAPVFRYHFTWQAPGATGQLVGSTHGIELPFVFQTFSSVNGFTPTQGDLALAAAVDGYWSRLAAAGDVNATGAVAWPTYDASTDPYLGLDLTIAPGTGLETTQCDAIDKLAM
ncbi:MAG TPA: carboxylesterase family protein [Kofleriaceae bacterium]|nr:carboxylesterase family protein [Kofleriaceae bacterium]